MGDVDPWAGEPGKYDALARRWAKEYATYVGVARGMSPTAARASSVKRSNGFFVDPTLEQLAWERAGSELSGSGAFEVAGSYFEGKPCRGECGREVVVIGGAHVVQNENGAWRGAIKGFCPACYARLVRKVDAALI